MRQWFVDSEQAAENLAAALSVLACPTEHAQIVPVELLTGEVVAALCIDCWRQLPPAWAPDA